MTKDDRLLSKLNNVSTQEVITKVVGDYHILKQIGSGGMSMVTLALDGESNQLRAIKVVEKTDNDKTKNEIVVNSAITEATTLRNLDNEYLPKIYSIIDTDELIYVVMEYIEGKSLSEIVKDSGAQNESDVVRWGKQLCETLDYLHSRKPPIVFRDMKPSNIMLKQDGNIKLIDFGIAREFKSDSYKDTVRLGTRGYAAPEQFDADTQSDERTDIYNLGATMYHLVTGMDPSKPPYAMKPIRQWDPNLSVELELIINKAIKPDPEQRYQSAKEMLADIEKIYTAGDTTKLSDPEETSELEDDGDNYKSSAAAGKNHKTFMKGKTGKRKIVIPAALVLVILLGVGLFITLSPTPFGVKDLTGEALNLSEISLKWSGSYKATGYEVTINGDEEAFKAAGKSLPDESIIVSDTSVILEGLVCDEKYEIVVRSFREKDGKTIYEKDNGAELVVAIDPPGPVNNLNAASGANGGAVISWDKLDLQDSQVTYSLLASKDPKGSFAEKYTGHKLKYADKNLAPMTEYFYKVNAMFSYDGKSFENISDTVSFTTGNVVLASPELSVNDETVDSVSLTWDPVTVAGSKITYSLLRSSSKSGEYSEVYNGPKTSYTGGGLDSGTNYYYKLVIECVSEGKEYRSESNIITAETKSKPVSGGSSSSKQDEKSEPEFYW